MSTLYIVEEKEGLFRMVSYGLAMEKEQVQTFPSRLEMERASSRRPDLLLLCGTGRTPWLQEELLQQKRQGKWADVPVILLAKQSTEEERIRGLDAGAELFLTEPFGITELRSYIQAVLRPYEYAAGTEREIHCGNLKIFPRKHRVTVRDREVEMTTNEFEILKVLAEHEGAALSREEIAGMVVTDGRSIRPSTVRSGIESLRKKLEKDGDMICTIRGVGYKLL